MFVYILNTKINHQRKNPVNKKVITITHSACQGIRSYQQSELSRIIFVLLAFHQPS